MTKHLKVFDGIDDLKASIGGADNYFVTYTKDSQAVRYDRVDVTDGINIYDTDTGVSLVVSAKEYYERYIFNKSIIRAKYLTFRGSGTVSLNRYGYVNNDYLPVLDLECSVDGGMTWSTYQIGTSIELAYKMLSGSDAYGSVMFRGVNQKIAHSNQFYHYFVMTGEIYASGDITSLNNKFGGDFQSSSSYTYYYLFSGCTSLVTAPNLPITSLADYCYCGMFSGCTSLETVPVLPATTLKQYCYASMFKGCTSLVTAPELPATTLASNCYASMFKGCTSLVTAPELPATTVNRYCYNSMFLGCTSLETAPVLPATALGLAPWCYDSMFKGCTSLVTAPELPATTLGIYCYREMFMSCTSLKTAPVLPSMATNTRDKYYYSSMFKGCSTLDYIKVMLLSVSSDVTMYWVEGVSASGTFVKHPDASWPTGTSGIPSGWTVETATE